MKFSIRLKVLGRALKLCVLSWVVAREMAILVSAEDLHLSGFCGHTSIGWVLWILSGGVSLDDMLDIIRLCRLAAILLCLELYCVGFAVNRRIVAFKILSGAILRVVIRWTCCAQTWALIWNLITTLDSRNSCVRICYLTGAWGGSLLGVLGSVLTVRTSADRWLLLEQWLSY